MTALAVLLILGTVALGAFVLALVGAIWRWDRQGESGRKFVLLALALAALTAFSVSEQI